MTIAEGTFSGLAGPEIQLFQSALRDVEGHGVEIGCLDGFSSAVILDSSKLSLTSVDPFIPDSMEPSLIGQKQRYLANVAPYSPRWGLLEMYSHEAVIAWNVPLDFLFIDGDHSYQAVLRDYDQWVPLLKKGSLLAIHDSRMSRQGGAQFHPGPSQVAADLVYGKPENWEIVGEAFSLTIARKLQ